MKRIAKLLAVALLVLAWAIVLIGVTVKNVHAENTADVIVLDDACRLIKKASKPIAKKKSFVIQYAKPASASVAKPKPIKRKPLFKRDVPPEYELNCDEGDAPGPLAGIITPPAPYTPVPEAATPPALDLAVPDLYTVPELPEVPTDAPATFVGVGYPVYVGAPPIHIVPAAAIPEPSTYLLFAIGLAIIVRQQRKHRK